MKSVRIGVLGLGNIGKHHATYLSAGKVDNAILSAVCTSSPKKAAEFPSARAFNDPHDLMHSGCVDALLIATPHHQHVTLGMSALEHGLHVMVEKPIAAHKADAERLIRASRRHPELVFAAMFQFRVEPRYQAIKRILDEGGLGRPLRITWIITDWFRTNAYYASSGWRATWKGEGGGVLINQCLHNLDTLQWLTGMPAAVRGFCSLGKHHDIEVEDEATACFEYANGATGTLITSTAESPGTNRLEIAGTKGKLLLENDRLLFTKNRVDSCEVIQTAQQGFVRIETETSEVPITTVSKSHAMLTQNFVERICGGGPLLAPGEEGLHSVELANAILFSSFKGETIKLPLDGAAYEKALIELAASSTREKKVLKSAGEDIAASFRR